MISPKNLIADFYMYEFLTNSEKTIDSDLELEIESQAMSFLARLKDYLIITLEYSIIREISHVWWETIQPNTMNPPTRDYLESFIHEDIFFLIADLSPEWVDSIDVELYKGEELKGSPRLRQYMYIKNNRYVDVTTFISKFKKYFTSLAWINNHGGNKWVSITNSYLKLIQTNGNDLFIVCDTIFWLQHNTNTIFNKIKAWEENGSYDWIKEFLDFRKECDLWDLWEHCRESKKVAGKKLKLLYNKTKEDANKEKIIMEIPVSKTEPIQMPTIDEIAEYANKPVFESIDAIMEILKQELTTINGKFDPINKELDQCSISLKNISEKLDKISFDITTLRNENNQLITKAFNNQQNILLAIDNLGDRISLYQNSTINAREDMYADMEKLQEKVTKQMKNYVDQMNKSLSEKFERELEERTNAILENLEQRWYKSLWKWCKELFTK